MVRLGVMTDRPVNLSMSGPPETVLDPEPADALEALAAAEAADDPVAAIGSVCARWPRFLAAWASLGDTVAEPLSEGLVREDGRILYRVQDDIPVMLIEESIEI